MILKQQILLDSFFHSLFGEPSVSLEFRPRSNPEESCWVGRARGIDEDSGTLNRRKPRIYAVSVTSNA